MPRYLHDHSKIYYKPTADLAETGYEVHMRKGDELVGRVRQSKSGHGWAWQIADAKPDDWVVMHGGTRKDATDHLLSAYSPSAAWLI